MTVPPEELLLAAEFPPSTRDDWRELALGVLRKSRPDLAADQVEQRLSRTTYDGVTVAALYDTGTADGVPGVHPYTRGTRTGGAWLVRQRHGLADPAATREAILADLENGVSALWLTVGDAGVPVAGLAEALRGVFVDLAPVTIDAGAQTAGAADAFLAILTERGIEDAPGNLGADPLGWSARTGAPAALDTAVGLARRCVDAFPQVRAITVDATVHYDAGGSDAEELGASLAAGVAYLRALTDAGLSVDQAFGQLEFRYAAGADQFLTIAKFRAARRLWSRVAEACGTTAGQRQHAVTSSAMMTVRDPWVNMLRTTLACFGAGVGGADSVTVQPFDARLGLPDGFARRIARNTQSLLLDESNVARVMDPAGGSWYVEQLTEDLAGAAWEWFTEIERAGGFAAALESGLIADRLAATWATRRANLAHRRDPLTGVSEFPNLAETLPVRVGAPAARGGGLPVVHYGQDFEELRDRADGQRVFLATIGPVAAHTARATFAANLFQAGGIATVTGGTATGGTSIDPGAIAAAFTASGATVACLCSSDALYGEYAAAVAAALKAAGARTIWLAGKGSYDAVDGYVYAGCDAIAVLTETLEVAR